MNEVSNLKDLRNYVMKSYEYLMNSCRETGNIQKLEELQKEKDEVELEYDKQIDELERGA
jgi:hypothetical protein